VPQRKHERFREQNWHRKQRPVLQEEHVKTSDASASHLKQHSPFRPVELELITESSMSLSSSVEAAPRPQKGHDQPTAHAAQSEYFNPRRSGKDGAAKGQNLQENSTLGFEQQPTRKHEPLRSPTEDERFVKVLLPLLR